MKALFKPFIALNLLIFCLFAFAQTDSTQATPSTTVPTNAPEQINQTAPAAPVYGYCPPINQLTKQGLYWQAPGGWVSYGESYDDKIMTFIGAQWRGVNVGKVICLYKGNSKMGFPVALEQKITQLIPTPFTGNWTKDLGGYKECTSTDVKQCLFIVKIPTQTDDIYKELDFFKDKSGIENNNELLPPRY